MEHLGPCLCEGLFLCNVIARHICSMGSALEKLKKAVSMKPQRRSVELPNGTDFDFWMTPLTLAERSRAQKQAKSDDATDFALQLLVTKAKDENGMPLFNQGELADLRNMLPASVVESLMLLLISGEEEEEEVVTDMKSDEGSTEKGQSSTRRTRRS
jgi:hypothetical protein